MGIEVCSLCGLTPSMACLTLAERMRPFRARFSIRASLETPDDLQAMTASPRGLVLESWVTVLAGLFRKTATSVGAAITIVRASKASFTRFEDVLKSFVRFGRYE